MMLRDLRDLSLCCSTLVATLAVLTLGGCTNPSSTEPKTDAGAKTENQEPLRLLVVDDPSMAAAIRRQWDARGSGELEIAEMTSDKLLDPRRKRLDHDAIIYPGGLLGELAERRLIAPIDREAIDGQAFNRRDIFDLVRQRELVWGNAQYAVPLGSPVLTVMYRRDIFEQLKLEPPADWTEYRAILKQLSDTSAFSDLVDQPSESWTAAAEPLGPGWASQTLLARAACYAKHHNYPAALFDMFSMEPRITTPPFVRALEELVDAAEDMPSLDTKLQPTDTQQRLLSGQCAIALGWPSRAMTEQTAEDQPAESAVAAGVIAYAELPGSATVYNVGSSKWEDRDKEEAYRVPCLSTSGRLGSVTKSARYPQAALNLLLLRFSGTEWSIDISPSSPATTLYRESQMPNASAWLLDSGDARTAEEYAETMLTAMQRPLWMLSPRLIQRKDYLAALDEAVWSAVRGDQTPQAALEAAAQRWQSLTREIGKERQEEAYWNSLGLTP